MMNTLLDLFTRFLLHTVTSWLDSPPRRIEKAELWFWTVQWQADEQAVEVDLQHNHFQDFGEVDELIYDLMTQAATACQICADDPNPTHNLGEALKRASHRGNPT